MDTLNIKNGVIPKLILMPKPAARALSEDYVYIVICTQVTANMIYTKTTVFV